LTGHIVSLRSGPSRRDLLKVAGATAGVAAVAGPVAAAAGGDAPVIPRRVNFSPNVGAVLNVRAGIARHRVRLVEVLDIQGATSPDRGFNLLFEPIGAALPEGIYRVSGRNVDPTLLFLSPVGLPGAATRLQAVVNRLA